jgi:hypothetical protein
MRSDPVGGRAAFFRMATQTLTMLQSQGANVYHRKALATLASLHFDERQFAQEHAFTTAAI